MKSESNIQNKFSGVPSNLNDFFNVIGAQSTEGDSAQTNEFKPNETDPHEMLAVVSHELRSPLMCLYALCEDGIEKLGPKDISNEVFLRIREQVRRIDFITRDLLGTFAPNMREMKCVPREFDFKKLLELVVSHIDLEYSAKKNLKIILSLPEEEVIGSWDPFRMSQLLQNLISNAIKYSKPTAADIRISLSRPNDESIAFTVRDNGVGIPSSDLKKIFELFERGTNESDFNVPGFGIGLRMAQQIVSQHGGEIGVQSELNFGSEFKVRLPLKVSSENRLGE